MTPEDQQHDREQWAVLANTPAFTSFFLPLIGSKNDTSQDTLIGRLNEQLLNAAHPPDVPTLRAQRDQLLSLRNMAETAMRDACKSRITKTK